MMTAEARVTTDRAGRYLDQLCSHLSQIAQAHPQMRIRVDHTDVDATISFTFGTCVLHAGSDALVLRAQAPDEAALLVLQERLAERLHQIGRRDELTVTWTRAAHTDQ